MREQLLQVLRRLARERFGDDRGGLVADAGDVLQPADLVEPLQLLDRHVLDLARGAPERLGLVPGLAAPYQEIGDALERLDGFHTSNVPFVGPNVRCDVGFYTEQIVPRMTNVMLGTTAFGKVRERVCAPLQGDVIELGFGSGLNLPYLPGAVTGAMGRRPVGRRDDDRGEADRGRVPFRSRPPGLDGARLDLPDDRFDSALSTMTLCTIPDVVSALAELRRVLKPRCRVPLRRTRTLARRQGRAHAATVRRFPTTTRRRLPPRSRHPCADRDGRLRASTSSSNFYLKGAPKAWSYMYVGRARDALMR